MTVVPRNRRVDRPGGYLTKLPGGLLRSLTTGRCVPVIGAGLSACATTPDRRRPPDWGRLGQQIADDLDVVGTSSPIEAISSYAYTYGRTALIERLSELLLVDEVEPGDVHDAFAQLPFETVITTNVDFLLEDAYTKQRRPHLALLGESQLAIQRRPAATHLVKLHGDLRHPDQLVMTEEDYDGFLRRNPLLVTYVSWLLLSRDPVFIGYSLDDADFREILTLLRERLGRMTRTPWVLLPTDHGQQARKFERRGVRPLVLNPDPDADRPAVLRQFFEELRTAWEETVIDRIDGRSDAVTAELRRRRIAPQLVLFVAGGPSLALYRDLVFPSVSNTGLLPIGIDEVRSRDPEMTPMAIDVALRKAAVVVYDTGRHTPYPLDYVAGRRGRLPLITVKPVREAEVAGA